MSQMWLSSMANETSPVVQILSFSLDRRQNRNKRRRGFSKSKNVKEIAIRRKARAGVNVILKQKGELKMSKLKVEVKDGIVHFNKGKSINGKIKCIGFARDGILQYKCFMDNMYFTQSFPFVAKELRKNGLNESDALKVAGAVLDV